MQVMFCCDIDDNSSLQFIMVSTADFHCVLSSALLAQHPSASLQRTHTKYIIKIDTHYHHDLTVCL